MAFFSYLCWATHVFQNPALLSLKFCRTHCEWGGTALSSKTEQCCVPRALRDGFGNSKVRINQVLLGSEGLQRQAGRESWELLDLGAGAQRDSILERGLQFAVLHQFIEKKGVHYSLKSLKPFCRPKSGPDFAAPQAPVPVSEPHMNSPPAPQYATTAELPVRFLLPG